MKSYEERFDMTGINEYSYQDLFDAFVKSPTESNTNRLAYWFERYGRSGWNGESWNWTDRNGFSYQLFPVQEESPDGDFITVTWDIR